MELLILLLVGIGVIAGAAYLVITGVRSAEEPDPLESRLAEFAETGETKDLQEIELEQPFMDRVVYPAAKKLGEIALKFTPQNALNETSNKLEKAGNPRGLEPTTFFAARFFLGMVFGVGFFLLLMFARTMNSAVNPFSMQYLFLAAFIMVFGFYIPDLLLTSTINRRQKEIRNSMPDALDLLTICVEAGLGFDAAMKKVNEKWDNELALAFGRALQEMQLGKLRREALRDMSDRLGVSELDSFIAAVIQSEQLGVSMSKVLRIQSDDMRIKRRQRAEEEAQKAPIKMLFPMAILIFPTIMLILLGPAALLLMRSALSEMLF